MSPSQFMKEYWQKKPLLVRRAIPAFALSNTTNTPFESPISAKELIEFATKEEIESRLVYANSWDLRYGPLKKKQIPKLETKDWTLLVQGMEMHHRAAQTILSWFRFIPDSRLDDLMISLAGPGGGVGPHLDSYDVFLIQMAGRRHWRISEQTDHTLLKNIPLKILANFEKEQEWILEPGDLLYLPPKIAHDGIALDPGTQTWSVGFRSPSWKELMQETLWHLADSLEDDPQLQKLITDPNQKATNSAAFLPNELVKEVSRRLENLMLHGPQLQNLVKDALGQFLSEPKPNVIIQRPHPHLSFENFWQNCLRSGLSINGKTRMLAHKNAIFCNGDMIESRKNNPKSYKKWLTLLLQKCLNPEQCQQLNTDEGFCADLYEAYLNGWVEVNNF